MRKTIGPSRRLTVKIAVIAVTLTVVGLAGNGQTSAATATVNVGDFWFCNSTFSGSVCPTSIKTGDTVTWNWVGSASHTTTACSDGTFHYLRRRTGLGFGKHVHRHVLAHVQ